MKAGGALIDLKYRGPKTRPPPIVALLDISGSMGEYTRLFLHFLHAVTDARKRVHSFLFGTRLTNVTRALKAKDPDEALAACSAARRRLVGRHPDRNVRSTPSTSNGRAGCSASGAIVLLITDGLERDADDRLAFEIDRLHRSCRRLIWLNPLLRFEGFEAKARGVQTMLPHVDEFRPVHNLASMEDAVPRAVGRRRARRPAIRRPGCNRWRSSSWPRGSQGLRRLRKLACTGIQVGAVVAFPSKAADGRDMHRP